MQEIQRKKKRFVQVAGNPEYAPRISPNKEIEHPRTGCVDWGQFPELQCSGRVFPAGPIRLRYGEHKGHQSGFGLAHIWEARNFKSEVLATPMSAIAHVANLIDSVLQPGAEIFHEGVTGKYERATVFKSANGTVIVEERVDGRGKAFYSIVTAIPNKKVRGVKIGAL